WGAKRALTLVVVTLSEWAAGLPVVTHARYDSAGPPLALFGCAGLRTSLRRRAVQLTAQACRHAPPVLGRCPALVAAHVDLEDEVVHELSRGKQPEGGSERRIAPLDRHARHQPRDQQHGEDQQS